MRICKTVLRRLTSARKSEESGSLSLACVAVPQVSPSQSLSRRGRVFSLWISYQPKQICRSNDGHPGGGLRICCDSAWFKILIWNLVHRKEQCEKFDESQHLFYWYELDIDIVRSFVWIPWRISFVDFCTKANCPQEEYFRVQMTTSCLSLFPRTLLSWSTDWTLGQCMHLCKKRTTMKSNLILLATSGALWAKLPVLMLLGLAVLFSKHLHPLQYILVEIRFDV